MAAIRIVMLGAHGVGRKQKPHSQRVLKVGMVFTTYASHVMQRTKDYSAVGELRNHRKSGISEESAPDVQEREMREVLSSEERGR